MLTALWCETHMNAARISRNLLVLGRSLPSSRVLTQNSRFMPQMCARSNPFYSGTRSLSSFRNTLRPMRKELTQLTPIRHLAKKSGEVKGEKLDMPSPKFTEATAKETPKVSDWKYAVRLIKLAKPEARLIAGAIGFLFVSSAITMAVPFSMGKIIDIATKSSNIPLNLELPQFFLLLGGVFTCGALANIGRILLIRIAGERVIARLRTNLYDSILKKDMTFFDANRSGDLISRLSLDTAIVGKTISNNVSDGLRSIITATAGLTTMAYVSGKLTLTMMVIVPPIALGGVFYGRYVKDLSRKTQDALGAITKVAEERIGNIRTVHAFVRESDEVKRYELRVQDVFNLAKKEAMANGIFFGGTGLAGNLTILALLGLGGRMVMEGSITVGQLTSFMLYTAYVGSSLMGLTNFYSELMKGIGASTRLFELIDEKPKISLEGGKILDDIRGEITFQNVQFAYPTRPGNEIFKDLTFTVEPGKMLAITGSSGGGKSTVSSLLLRYYDPLQGSILIDGHDIRSLNLRWLRNQIGIVSQEPTLFAGTIGENIAYGKKGATREEIEEAARQANCNFIENFKDGFNTYVGERGISLSGGQKQRIAIARALLKNPRILILDEATSALDGESEYLVQEALDRLTLNRTTLTIAHRISTIRISDVVICLHGGKVHEQGSFYELSQREDGIFRKLMERQMLNNSNS